MATAHVLFDNDSDLGIVKAWNVRFQGPLKGSADSERKVPHKKRKFTMRPLWATIETYRG
jgi:hypothetical protein